MISQVLNNEVLWHIEQGNALDVLRKMPDESIQCVVTSPPYWGLRDYGVEGQIGLEPSPETYIEKMVEVFREVRRVLRSDGTLWLNLGDSYATGAGKVGDHPGGGKQGAAWKGDHSKGRGVPSRAGRNYRGPKIQPNRMPIPGLKRKDLVGIPWRMAFALQADGWWLRSDIIWHKPNPMPESVTDRPTKAHEYIFLLTKSERYFYDAEAIKEPASLDSHARYARGRSDTHKWADGGPTNQTIAKTYDHMFPKPSGWDSSTGSGGHGKFHRLGVDFRNKRSVWTVATYPFHGAHFATFPPKLIEPCILAGSKEGDLILDPFSGSGTVGMVALRYGRKFIGLELNEKYCEMARRRIVDDAPILNKL